MAVKILAALPKAAKAVQAASEAAKAADRATGGTGDSEVTDAADATAGALDKISTIREKLESGETLSDEELKDIISISGLPEGVPADWDKCCEGIDINTGETSWIDPNEQVLEQLANHVYNHVYHYKPEATEVDPSIDPSETQIGATAQEIEKVNPSAVSTDPETGAKIVDTQKVVMTLAGAMGQMARKMDRMESKIEDKSERATEAVFLGKWGSR